MIWNNLTTEKNVPNFLNYIHEDSLKAIKPEALNIILKLGAIESTSTGVKHE